MPADFIITEDAPTTVLSAVNAMLASIGETRVSTIDPPPTSEVSSALQKLQQADLMVQSRGWSWNTEINLPLLLDGDSKAPLPNFTLRVNAAYYTNRNVLNAIGRGEFLYDRTNHTYVFTTGPLYVDVVARLAWDLLPQAARNFILLTAVQAFQADYQDRPIQVRVTDSMVSMAKTTLEQHEDTQTSLNSVYDNISALNALGGIRRRGMI